MSIDVYITVSGGPGRGKTFVMSEIVKALKKVKTLQLDTINRYPFQESVHITTKEKNEHREEER